LLVFELRWNRRGWKGREWRGRYGRQGVLQGAQEERGGKVGLAGTEGCSRNNLGMHLEVSVPDAQREVLGAPESPACAAIWTNQRSLLMGAPRSRRRSAWMATVQVLRSIIAGHAAK
jgi:hypothetical protein